MAVGAWVAMNAAAIAYGRGAGAGVPVDALYGLSQHRPYCQCCRAYRRTQPGRGQPPPARGVVRACCLAGVRGRRHRSADRADPYRSRRWRQFYAAHSANVRTFVITDNLADFTSNAHPRRSHILTRRALPSPCAIRSFAAFFPPLSEPHCTSKPTARQKRLSSRMALRQRTARPAQSSLGLVCDRGRATRGRFDSKTFPGCTAGLLLEFAVSGYLGRPITTLQ